MAVLALSSTELIFAAAGREHGWDMVIILQHLTPLQEAGEGTLSSMEEEFLMVKKTWRREPSSTIYYQEFLSV